RHAGLACNCPRKERLAGAWRADEKNPFGDAGPERREFLRVLEELDHLGELFLRFINASDVREGDGHLTSRKQPGPALPEAHCLGVGSLRLAHDQQQEQTKQQEGQEVEQKSQPWPESGAALVFEVYARVALTSRFEGYALVAKELFKVGIRTDLRAFYDG